MRFPLFERHPREELSGYLDKELAFPRVEAVEAHLSTCPTCRAELDALRTLKSNLAALPESPAPRSFALTPAMAQRPAPAPARLRAPARVAALTNGMRLAGAGMAVALAAIMVLNFSGSGSTGGNDSASTALIIPQARSTDTTAQYSNDANSAELGIPTPNPSTAESPLSTAAPPSEGATDGNSAGVGSAPTPAAGGVGGGAPGVGAGGPGVGGVDGSEDSTPATPTLVPASTFPPTASTAADGAFVPEDASPAATDLTGKTIADAGSPRVDTTGAVIKNLETDQPGASEAARDALSGSDGGGVDILTLVAIALAAGVVLAFAGSVLVPRIARDD